MEGAAVVAGAYTGFKEADWILTSIDPLGIFFGTGAFVSFTRALAGSPFLTILHTVWTDGRDVADVEVEAMTGQWKQEDRGLALKYPYARRCFVIRTV